MNLRSRPPFHKVIHTLPGQMICGRAGWCVTAQARLLCADGLPVRLLWFNGRASPRLARFLASLRAAPACALATTTLRCLSLASVRYCPSRRE